ncbi:alpha/beta fold hydrolase [Pseudonocardia xinjiangensis]|uniref:alpha/beta fold hydrolase n=1 Tax=Pseudonocardia xinjiangensis TaxID=75289 RepID=UPI003D8DC18B
MAGTFTTNDGATLRYTTTGAGEPVVFVHGWLLSSRFWEPITAQLPGHLRVTYDHRGHGASADAAAGWHLHRLAFDLHELLEHLDLHDVTLVGHSMGCVVTWAYHELFGPARLRKLVLVDQAPTVCHDPEEDAQARARTGSVLTDEELAGLVHAIGDPETHEGAVEQFFSGMVTPNFSDAAMRDLLAVTGRPGAAFSAALVADFGRQDWRREIRRITLPTLVIAGRESPLPWAGSRWVADHIPGARLEVVEGADGGSHMLIVEADKRVAELLATFLAE